MIDRDKNALFRGLLGSVADLYYNSDEEVDELAMRVQEAYDNDAITSSQYDKIMNELQEFRKWQRKDTLNVLFNRRYS